MKLTLRNTNIVTEIDDEDYDLVKPYPWRLTWGRGNTPRVFCTFTRRPYYVNFQLSRVIMFCPPQFVVDHIDGNTLNNMKSNLRICTQLQNCGNIRHTKDATPTSRFKGVSRQYSKWVARICGKVIGRFQDEKDAALAYNNAALDKWGEFAYTNKL